MKTIKKIVITLGDFLFESEKPKKRVKLTREFDSNITSPNGIVKETFSYNIN